MEVASIKRGPFVRFRSTKLRDESKYENVVRSARFGNEEEIGCVEDRATISLSIDRHDRYKQRNLC